MGKPLAPPLIEAMRVAYVTDPTRPSYRKLAAKFHVSRPAVEKYGRLGGWAAQRMAHIGQRQIDMQAAVSARAEKTAHDGQEQQTKSTQMLEYMRDGIMGAFQQAARRVVAAKGLTPEDARLIVQRWEELATKDVLRFMAEAPQAVATITKALELLAGRPTEQVALQASVEWRELRVLILDALVPFPEARLALAQVLTERAEAERAGR